MTEEPVDVPEEPQVEDFEYDPPSYPGITFDDVLIAPAYSDIESRQEIDTSVDFLGLHLSVPIISANMDYITGPEMVRAMHNAGGLGILHRFAAWEQQLEWMDGLDKEEIPFFFSVGIRDLDESKGRISDVFEDLPNAHGVCIDVAHGHHKKVGELLSWIKLNFTEKPVIAGNIATAEGALFLVDSGADAVKVGIGAGSVCTTRLVAGVGVPQLSAIIEAAWALEGRTPIIADGGIRQGGDLVKCFSAGATTVMLGALLAGTNETPTERREGKNGVYYRPYRGQSIFGTNGERYVKEGVEGFVPEKGSVAKVVADLQGSLRSAMSYVGARNLEEFYAYSNFVACSPHTYAESGIRVLQEI